MARAATDPYEASIQLLACLTVKVQAAANPPANIQFLPGQQAGEDLSIYQDLCCEGTAYVRVTTEYPSFQEFPAPDSLPTPCQQQAFALGYEVGIMRCSPVGDIAEIPTAEQWRQAHQQSLIDAKSIYDAICCYRGYYSMDAMVVGAWAPIGPQGGCLLGAVNLTHQISACRGGPCG
jgi:hypothetical protein